MKIVLVALALLTSLSSYAASDLACKEIGTGPDNGYTAVVKGNLKSTVVSLVTIAGANTLAELACTPNKKRLPGNDRINEVAHCSEPNIRDAGYSLTVKQGGFAGGTTADLYSINFAGATKVATLICQ